MSSRYRNQQIRQFAPLALPVICTVGILVFLPTTIAVVLLGVLTVGFVVTAYRL